MKYIVTLDIEVEDENSEEDVRRAIEGVTALRQMEAPNLNTGSRGRPTKLQT